jgi:hypothetical protein
MPPNMQIMATRSCWTDSSSNSSEQLLASQERNPEKMLVKIEVCDLKTVSLSLLQLAHDLHSLRFLYGLQSSLEFMDFLVQF